MYFRDCINPNQTPTLYDYPSFLKKINIVEVDAAVREYVKWQNTSRNQEIDCKVLMDSVGMLLSTRCPGLNIVIAECRTSITWHDTIFSNSTIKFRTITTIICTLPGRKAGLLNRIVSNNLMHIAVSLDSASNQFEIEDAQALARLLTSQTRLKKFELARCGVSSPYVMSALRSQANSLRYIGFAAISFSKWITLEELVDFEQLETIVFNGCFDISAKLIAPIIIPNLLEIYLDVTPYQPEISDVCDIIARNFNNTLRVVNLGRHDGRNVIEPFAKWCPELREFSSSVPNGEIWALYDLLECCTHIEKVNVIGDIWNEFDVNQLFSKLGNLQLPNLRHLSICGKWQFSAGVLDQWLAGSAPALESLEFSWPVRFTEEHLEVIVRRLSGTLRYLKLQLFDAIDVDTICLSSCILALEVWPDNVDQ